MSEVNLSDGSEDSDLVSDLDSFNISKFFTELPSDVTGTGSFADILKGLGSVFAGTSSLGKSGQLTGLLGIAALANKMFGSSGGGGFAGYSGKIPTYTATRTMNTIPTTMANPLAGQTGQPAMIPRRPGSGGITYFSPMVYTPVSTATGGSGNNTVAGGAGNDTVSGGSSGSTVTGARGGIMSLRSYANGGTVSAQRTAQTPYEIYDRATNTFAYTDAPGFERWMSGLPLEPINRVPGSPVYMGGPEKQPGDYNAFASSPLVNYVPTRTLEDSYFNEEGLDEDYVNSKRFEIDAAIASMGGQEGFNKYVKEIESRIPEFQNILGNPDYAPVVDPYVTSLLFNPMSTSERESAISHNLGAYIDNMRSPSDFDPPAIINVPEQQSTDSIYSYPATIEEARQAPRAARYDFNTGNNHFEYASGGVMSLRNGHLGSYSDGGQLLRGPGDGVSDDIPATIADRQPARLADGEFVIPARIVSELGNGSTEAGARKLYAMMDRIKNARRKAKDIAADTKTDRYLPR